MADALRALDLRYVALNPGASYRGLHDSIVNHLGNENPEMLVCLHEEAAVAIAHGYAKVCEKPMGVLLHSNVGLMHASMAIFNAWCDRVPILLFGATGPVDAAARRPWIDWIHTSTDQAALVRNFTKWDDQPGSVQACVESILRAGMIAGTPPHGPVLVTFDASLQEAPFAAIPIPDPTRFATPMHGPHPNLIAKVADLLSTAKHPVILAGRVSRDPRAWRERIELAERLGARVLTDAKMPAAFPTHHPLHPHPPMVLPSDAGRETLGGADVVLALSWSNDLGGTLRAAFGDAPSATVVTASIDFELHRGWNMEYMPLATVDVALAAEPDTVVTALLAKLGPRTSPNGAFSRRPVSAPPNETGEFGVRDVAAVIAAMTGHRATTMIRVPLGWNWEDTRIDDPLDFIGYDGGAGIGSGPGMAVGAGLALRDFHPERLPLAVLGDGDFLMGASAIWTAVHAKIPLLVVVANNRTYFNDEVHQQRVAERRGRQVERSWIGLRITDPAVDIANLARSFGASGYGPVGRRDDFERAFSEALAVVDRGGVAIIDAFVPSR